MLTRWTRWIFPMLLGTATPAFSGCGSGSNDRPSAADEQVTGRVQLSLVTANQANFRLRQAAFEIKNRSGSQALTLDSDADPQASVLTADLAQDFYRIELKGGWVVERLDGDTFSAVSAALVTQNPQDFQIRDARTTSISYAFSTDDGVVRFGQGTLEVRASVVDSATLASCDVLNAQTCATGQTCLLVSDSGRTFCAEPGALAIGAACDSEQCVAGAQCLKLDPAQPTQGVCSKFCDPANPPFGCACRSLSFDPGIGICGPSNVSQVLYSHTFPAGSSSSSATCQEWNAFRGELAGGSFGRVVMSGSLDSVGQACDDPAAATQICNSLASGTPGNVPCAGHVWNVGFCGNETESGSFLPAVELSVDNPACGCGNNSVRPCMNVAFGGGTFGGVGASACSASGQRIDVACMSSN